jgi:hypothetical protein
MRGRRVRKETAKSSLWMTKESKKAVESIAKWKRKI